MHAFVDVCFYQKPEAEVIAKAVGYNMLVPPVVRAASRLRQEDRRAVAEATTKPCWVAWGVHERLAPSDMGEQSLAHFPNSQGQLYHNSGHSPFWEEAEAFNADLTAFAAQCGAGLPAHSPPQTIPMVGGSAVVTPTAWQKFQRRQRASAVQCNQDGDP